MVTTSKWPPAKSTTSCRFQDSGRSPPRSAVTIGVCPAVTAETVLGPVPTELLHGPRGRAQRAVGLDLHRLAPGPVTAIAARTGPRPTPAAQPAVRRFPGRRRIALTAVTMAATACLGVAAPLAHAYNETPARFTAVARYLDGDGRWPRPVSPAPRRSPRDLPTAHWRVGQRRTAMRRLKARHGRGSAPVYWSSVWVRVRCCRRLCRRGGRRRCRRWSRRCRSDSD